MDPRLLAYYNKELGYMREMGAEFAAHYPKVAGRLGMRGIEIADPYVERLLEGFCFLAARIHLKMDAEFPRFSQRLLETIYPNYLAPTPSMCIVQCTPGETTGSQSNGHRLPRGTRLRTAIPGIDQAHCEFRTAHDVDLRPMQLREAKLESFPADLPLHRLHLDRPVKAALSLRFAFTAPPSKATPPLDRVSLHLCGDHHYASRLYELLCGHTLGLAVRPIGNKAADWSMLPATQLRGEGFGDDEALLPYANRGFQAYRLLHEYFAFPARYHFIGIEGLARALDARPDTESFEIIVLFDKSANDLEKIVDTSHFALFCTPAVNLISMRSDRIPIGDSRYEFHVVPDRALPLNYEVFSVEATEGYGKDNTVEAQFRPFYTSFAGDRSGHGTYFSMRREPRRISEVGINSGPRSTYIGSEVFLSLVDQREAPYKHDLRQLGADITVTNRDLPLLMSIGNEHDLTPVESLPVRNVRILRGPTHPVPAVPEGELTWRLISHLGLGYQTLTDTSPEQGAEALRELFSLYAALGDPVVARHGQALLSAKLSAITRRLPGAGPLTFGRGVAIDITVDEAPFAGTSPYLFGAVLEHYFARHVSINTFTELRFHSAQRGKLGTWQPRFGQRPIA